MSVEQQTSVEAGQKRKEEAELDRALGEARREKAALEARCAQLEAAQLALERSRAELERLRHQEGRLRRQFEALDRASVALQQALTHETPESLQDFFRVVVDEARALAGAELALLALGTDVDKPFASLVFSGPPGVGAPEPAALRASGVLGEVLRTGSTLRIRDLGKHPLRAELPVVAKGFLGVPIRVAQRTRGGLFLINKAAAEEFSDEDQRDVELLAQRVQASMEVARLHREALEAIKARDNLLAVVSHDLRNPLSAIQLYAAMLCQPYEGGERRRSKKQSEIILRSAKQMNRLIDDLLQAASIEEGTFAIEPASESIGPVLDEVVQALEGTAAARSIQLSVRLPEALPPARCDRQRVMQVLANLVANAIKFSPPESTVGLSAQARGSDVVVAVTDAGPGIAPEHLPLVFDRYWKGAPGAGKGVGLGLFIAKGIVEAHGGRIWAESEVGRGTTFFFSLPIDGVRANEVGRIFKDEPRPG